MREQLPAIIDPHRRSSSDVMVTLPRHIPGIPGVRAALQHTPCAIGGGPRTLLRP